MEEKTSEKITGSKRHSKLTELAIRMWKEKPLGTACAVITLIFILVAIFAPLIAPYGINDVHAKHALEGPSAQFWLGTDNIGRDLLSRIIFGARVSVIVGLVATLISTIVMTFIGILSAYIGGTFDLVLQRFIDAEMSIPGLILLMVIISMIGTGLWHVIFVLGITNGIGNSRMVRSLVIGVKEDMYISSAVALGAPTGEVIIRHILPNIMAQIIILASMNVPFMILSEAGLSFLGFGVPPPAPTWGGMLSGAARQYMFQDPWMALWPGLVLSILVYAVNMFGDALRDLLDPRLRGGLGRYGGKIKHKGTVKGILTAPEEERL
jgi:peptide/nickel transport system permease protein